jgi:hypothetical protein
VQAEDAKFEDSQGFIIDPTANAKPRKLGDEFAKRRKTEMRGDS